MATVSAELVAELGLKVGADIDTAGADRLRLAAARLAVFDKAVELLAVRARSARELRLRLRRAGAADDAIVEAIVRLQALGVLDDREYARQVARSRVVGGGVSKRRIAEELQRRGVTRRVVDEAIAETLDEVELDEEGAARAAAEKRLRSLRSYDLPTRRKRLYAFLARRGYAPDVVARVLRDVMGRADAPLEGGESGDDDVGSELGEE
ncbi:MAG: RecX family transcriptional regulator [Gemmatimonadaceae bacterium]|nr:RecX family transcriptional regulator [Gemmatimonadaceae bacterium]